MPILPVTIRITLERSSVCPAGVLNSCRHRGTTRIHWVANPVHARTMRQPGSSKNQDPYGTDRPGEKKVFRLKDFTGDYRVMRNPFSSAMATNAAARYSACFWVEPYVLNFQIFVAPGITPVTPRSVSALAR